jgi:hypothetical protein
LIRPIHCPEEIGPTHGRTAPYWPDADAQAVGVSDAAAGFGIASASGAWRSISRALARIPKQEADQAREAQLARLQAVRMLLWNHAGTDPVRAAEALIKLEAREARLLGLDMPTKVAVTDPDRGILLETIRRVMERVDRQMVDVTPQPAPLPLDHKRH